MKFLEVQKLLLTLCGFNIRKKENWARILNAALHILFLALISVAEFQFVIENIVDIPLVTDALCPLLTSILSTAKLLTVLVTRKKFYKMIWTLENMWNDGRNNERYKYINLFLFYLRLNICF